MVSVFSILSYALNGFHILLAVQDLGKNVEKEQSI